MLHVEHFCACSGVCLEIQANIREKAKERWMVPPGGWVALCPFWCQLSRNLRFRLALEGRRGALFA